MDIAAIISPEAAWASVAPTLLKPCNTTANDDANPTNAANKPANTD